MVTSRRHLMMTSFQESVGAGLAVRARIALFPLQSSDVAQIYVDVCHLFRSFPGLLAVPFTQ